MGVNEKIKTFFSKKRNVIAVGSLILLVAGLIVAGYFLFKPNSGASVSTGVIDDSNGGDSSDDDSSGGDSSGGGSTGGGSTGGDSTGDDIPDHWTPSMYNSLKTNFVKQNDDLKSKPALVNCIVNNIANTYKNPQSLKTESDQVNQTMFSIVESCNSGGMTDPGPPKFGKPNGKSNRKPNDQPQTDTGIANDTLKNCKSSARKVPPYKCDEAIITCARKQPACLKDKNCVNDVGDLAQNYCTQIHGKKLPIKPPSSDSSGFYSYCDEKCKCVKTKGEHPAGHDLYPDPYCSNGGKCTKGQCKPLHSIKHGVF
jgi:hypothetical protein